MLKLENITVRFGSHQVLRSLSCEIYPGDFIVIVGTNGAGKSTLFDIISGKIRPQHGRIIFDGSDITSLDQVQRASTITRIFQNTRLNSVGAMTVYQNLAIAHYSRRNATLAEGTSSLSREKAEALVADMGMKPSILDKYMNDLSGGQRQLIAFTMSTQYIPKVLLLDEPTAALDPQASTKLLVHAAQFIKQHAITTVLITHDPHIALSMGNKIWILENGTITKQYSAQEKKFLNPEQLIGHIDYARLKSLQR